MPSFVAMNPFRCRMWEFHDRLEAHISEQTCRDEIESFSRHGQFVPVLGRTLHGDPSYEAELVRTHLPLVHYAVAEMATRIPRHVSRDDLASAGMAGLAQAARNFDASRGIGFQWFDIQELQDLSSGFIRQSFEDILNFHI